MILPSRKSLSTNFSMAAPGLKGVLLALALAGALGFGAMTTTSPCLVTDAPDNGSLGACSDESADDGAADTDGTCSTALADSSCSDFCSGEGSMSYSNSNGAETCTCGTGKCCSDASPGGCARRRLEDGFSLAHGESCAFSCDTGYTLSGDTTCDDGDITAGVCEAASTDGTCATELADSSCSEYCDGEGSMSYSYFNGEETCTCGSGKCCSDSAPEDCD